jgi:MoaE-MoaD fusion protein
MLAMRILFFAALRELAGTESMEWNVVLPATVGMVWNQLLERFPPLKSFQAPVLFAVNQVYARADTPLQEGDELAVFPPVSGGGTFDEDRFLPDDKGDIYAIVRHSMEEKSLMNRLVRPEDGAAVSFSGVVRNQSEGRQTLFLEYEGYESMALSKLREIGEIIRKRWDVGQIGIVHRLGRIEIGESSVFIVITSPHRAEAFEACRYAIDTLKQVVPIWKKEHFVDGEVWVEGNQS